MPPSAAPSRLGGVCALLLLAATLVATLSGAIALLEAATKVGFFGSLPRGLKASDDHGVVAYVALRLAEVAGERDPVAVTTARQSGILRYYLMPRPVYVLPEAASPALDPAYVARHKAFLERRGVRWLVWVSWDEKQGAESWRRARLHDAASALGGGAGPGVRVWCHAARERPTGLADYLAAAGVVALIVVLGWAAHAIADCRLPIADSSPTSAGRDAPGVRMGWQEALPRHFALGLIALYAALSWPMLLGLRLGRGVVLGIGAALVAALVTLRVIRGRRASPSPSPSPTQPSARSSARPSLPLVRAAAIALCVAMVLSVGGLALTMPVRNVDAVHHWGYAAKIFHYEGGVWNPLYFDPERGYPYARYPILVPLALFTVYEAVGRVEDQAAKVLFPAFFGMLLLALYGAMRRERPGLGALLVVLCVACCTAYQRYEGGAVSALADVPLSLFLLLGLVEWCRWAEGGGRDHLFAWVLFLCGAAVTKMEGQLALAAALVAAALLRRKVRPIPWRRVALAAACVGLLVLPWLGFTLLLPKAGGFMPAEGTFWSTVRRNLALFPASAGEFLKEAANLTKDPEGKEYVNNWGGFWLLAVAAVALGWRQASLAGRLVVALVLVQLAAYFAAFLVNPIDPRHLVGTTKMRLLLQLAPVAAWLAWRFFPPLPRWLEALQGRRMAG